MPFTNYHSHTHFCDGSSEPEEYIKEAIKQNFAAYGFSSHAPLPFECEWTIKKSDLSKYLNEIDHLKNKYRNKIQISRALEVDYIPGISGLSKPEINSLELDYIIGSIHFVGDLENKDYWQIDNTADIFHDGLNKIFDGDIRTAITRYFTITREMIENNPPDVIGHLDKIKMHNTGNKYFDENEEWYQNEIDKTLNLIKEKNVIIEINTRGYYKRNESLSPGIWILKKIREMDVPVVVNSDSHLPNEISMGMHYTFEILKNLKFDKVTSFFDKSWQSFLFDTEGIKIN